MPSTEDFSASKWFIHFDELCNYLHSFQKQLAAILLKNNCCFPDQEHVGHSTNKIYWNRTWLSHQICFKGHSMRILLPRMHLLLLLLLSLVVVVIVVAVVVVAVIVIVLVVLVVVKSWPGLVNTIQRPGPLKEFFSVRVGKHTSEARVGKKYSGQGRWTETGGRAGKHKLVGQGWKMQTRGQGW